MLWRHEVAGSIPVTLTMQDLLRELEILLDDLNSRYGNEKELCLYCHSNEYDSSGIVHDEKCIIIRLRKEL